MLIDKKCQACEGGVPPLSLEEAKKLLGEIPNWQIGSDGKHLVRKFNFKGFYATMSFINAVAFVVQKEGHHPDMEVGFNYATIKFTTHAIDGLTENDFICAAKVDAL